MGRFDGLRGMDCWFYSFIYLFLMRALLCIPHYFKPEEGARHSSVDPKRANKRRDALRLVLESWRGIFSGPSGLLTYTPPRDVGVVPLPSRVRHLDICVMVDHDYHLLDQEMMERYAVRKISVQTSNPRFLGFGAYSLMERAVASYDWFLFSEDDLCMRDAFLFEKLEWFQRQFGEEALLAPNRYEWNARARYLKTYVDFNLRSGFIDPLLQLVEGESALQGEVFGRMISFERARNPHSGFFAVSRAQLEGWMKKAAWKSYDASFIGPLESAATLGILKQFAIYKAAGQDAAFLEIEHLDDRFSAMTVRR